MFEKVEKIGCHSNFNFECNTERGSKESLSIALGLDLCIYRSIHFFKPSYFHTFILGTHRKYLVKSQKYI